jgi:hypothetical protein
MILSSGPDPWPRRAMGMREAQRKISRRIIGLLGIVL